MYVLAVPLVSIQFLILISCPMNGFLTNYVQQPHFHTRKLAFIYKGYYENTCLTIKQNKPGLLSTNSFTH